MTRIGYDPDLDGDLTQNDTYNPDDVEVDGPVYDEEVDQRVQNLVEEVESGLPGEKQPGEGRFP